MGPKELKVVCKATYMYIHVYVVQSVHMNAFTVLPIEALNYTLCVLHS